MAHPTTARDFLKALCEQLRLPQYRARQLREAITAALREERQEVADEITPENTQAACKAAGTFLYVEGYAAGVRQSADILSDLAQRKIHHAASLEAQCREVLRRTPAFEAAEFVLKGAYAGREQVRQAGLHGHALLLPDAPRELPEPRPTTTDVDAK